MLKVAHMVKITPNSICGLYETTTDLVRGLRAIGFDSRMVETDIANNPLFPYGQSEVDGIPIEVEAWAIHSADIIVSHSGYGDAVAATGKPVIYVAHGRPLVSYLTEKSGGLPLYSFFYTRNLKRSWASVVTFWPEHLPYLDAMFSNIPAHLVPAAVDLEKWNPVGAKSNFNGVGGDINVVCADAWREDIDPFVVLNAFILEARREKAATGKRMKLHIYGKPKDLAGAGALVRTIQDEGFLGEVNPHHKDLASVYRAADFTMTPHTIAVRTVRESMACGCPVAHIGLDLKVPRTIYHEDRAAVRERAVKRFDHRESAAAMSSIIRKASMRLAA